MSYKLIHGDCLEVMPTLADKSIDAIICDLPYGTTSCHWDSVIPFEPLWAQYKRLIKPRGAIVLFGSQPFTSALVMSNIEWFRYCWVWNKKNPANFLLANKQPMRIHEDICVFYKEAEYRPVMKIGEFRKKGGGKLSQLHRHHEIVSSWNNLYFPSSILEFGNTDKSNLLHPTQKPVDLLAYLIRTYTSEGETILDNTMGSGSTIVAAIQEGRNAIGIERDADYFAIAQQRCLEATYQPSLFTPQPTQWEPVAMFGDD